MIPRSMELYLRAHTHVEGAEPSGASGDFRDRWAPMALILDCETTIDARQTFNFGFYRKGVLRGESYVCIEEGIVYADDLNQRLGKHAVGMLARFADAAQTDTVRGRNARMRLHSQTDFVRKVLLPMYLKESVIVGANLCFDLSRLAVEYKASHGANDVWSLAFKKHKGLPDKIQPRLIMTPRNSRSAFLKFTYGHKKYAYGAVSGGRFLDVLTLAFALRNSHHSLDSACSEWKVPTKFEHDPTGRITLPEIKYCRQDVKCTLDLLNALKREFDALPVDIPPEGLWSPASLSKAFLDSMGLQHPLEKFSLSDSVHGIAMQSYYGGRAECRIRKTKMPVMFVDFTSQYPTCNSLLGIWDFMIAEDVSVREDTKEVREFLDWVTLEKMFDRKNWQELNFLALVQPSGDMLPVRAVYNDSEGESTNIGINPLTSKVPIWYSGPDLAASKILTGRSPKIIKAIRITPVGVQKGLTSTTLGDRKIEPERDNFYNIVIEGKEQSSGPIKQFYKCLANAGCYGLSVEVNGKKRGRNNRKRVRVFSGEMEFDLNPKPEKVELPGQWFCPFIASWITAGGRLLLAMLERTVTNAGGAYLMCDTDSMAIVATEEGALVACDGGQHRQTGARDAVRALSWSAVELICKKFQKLNPYNPTIVKELLKIEDCNYERAFDKDAREIKGEQHQLYAFAISSKRYCLFTDRDIIKPSEHALGVYFFPDKRERHTPSHFKAKKYPRWIVEAWERILDLNERHPHWFKYSAMRRLAITTPNVLRTLRSIDHEAARPYTFVISPVLSLSNTVLVASFCDKPSLWDDLDYVCVDTGEKGKLRNWVLHVEGKLVPLVTQTMGHVIKKYGERPEFKSLGPDGSLCAKNTVGLLRRRPVIAKPIFQLIGKEVDRGTSEDAFVAGGEQLMRYQSWEMEAFPRALKKLSDREIARQSGLDAETVSRIRRRRTGRAETRAKLMKFARRSSTAPVSRQ